MVSFDSNSKPNMQQKTVTLLQTHKADAKPFVLRPLVSPDPVKAEQLPKRARQQANN